MKGIIILLFFVPLLALLSIARGAEPSPALLRQTTHGPVMGFFNTTDQQTNQVYLGIPFAAPPVGTLRWQPPRAPTPWTTPRNATKYGKVCVQTITGQTPAPPPASEDCLFINVVAPQYATPNSNLPVYVYQYGGQWKFGYSDKYDGAFLSGQDIIVVTFNYRTGAMGFLAHPLLLNNPENTTGMYGIQDQRAALQWVHDNIANFGGNPNKVTWGGQSAGGGTLCVQLVSPRSVGLFQAAIMQSPSCAVLYTRAQGFAIAETLVTKFGCTMSDPEAKLACMLTLDPMALILDGTVGSGTMATDYEIMKWPVDLIRAGEFTPVPLLSGQQWNESSNSACRLYDNMTSDQYYSRLQSTYPSNWQQYAEVYDLARYPTPTAAWISILTDINFKCTTKAVLDAYSDHYPNVWVYSMEQPISDPGLVTGTSQCLGSSHGWDNYFLFPSYVRAFSAHFTPAEDAFARKLREVWLNFIRTHNALLPGYQPWPRYTFTEGLYGALSDKFGIHIGSNYKQRECPLQGVPSPTCSASASLVARSGSSWSSNGVNYQIFDVKVQNTGDKKVTFLSVSISTGSASITQQWNLNAISANVYSLPSWYQGFQVDGTSSDAGFILAGTGSLSPAVSIETLVC